MKLSGRQFLTHYLVAYFDLSNLKRRESSELSGVVAADRGELKEPVKDDLIRLHHSQAVRPMSYYYRQRFPIVLSIAIIADKHYHRMAVDDVGLKLATALKGSRLRKNRSGSICHQEEGQKK